MTWLYTASVPVFLHYLPRIAAIAADHEAHLDARIDDSFGAGQHLRTAIGFTLRGTFGAMGAPVPELRQTALPARAAEAAGHLRGVDPAAFDPDARVRHRAGQAELDQSATDFLLTYALPNHIFHLTMAYASLRAAGCRLGKADFDGLHHYATNFRFL
jgi:uncharacterized protein